MLSLKYKCIRDAYFDDSRPTIDDCLHHLKDNLFATRLNLNAVGKIVSNDDKDVCLDSELLLMDSMECIERIKEWLDKRVKS